MSSKEIYLKKLVVLRGLSTKISPEETVRDAPSGGQASAETDDRAIKVEAKTKR